MSASVAIAHYAKRFSIEENFRDTKDIKFGMGLLRTSIGCPAKRDRILLVGAIAVAFLTILGAAGEATSLDMKLKADTSSGGSIQRSPVKPLGARENEGMRQPPASRAILNHLNFFGSSRFSGGRPSGLYLFTHASRSRKSNWESGIDRRIRPATVGVRR